MDTKKYLFSCIITRFTIILLLLCPTMTYAQEKKLDISNNTVDDLIIIISDDKNWDFVAQPLNDPNSNVAHATELLGYLRQTSSVNLLVKRINVPISSSTRILRGYKDAFVAASLINIGESAIEPILDRKKIHEIPFFITYYFGGLMPRTSSVAIIDNYIATHGSMLDNAKIDDLNSLKESIHTINITQSRLPTISKFVLNHPLYKKRQSAIDLNLLILKEQKNIIELNIKTFNAIQKLGELRAVEAVEVLTPYLLFQSKTEIVKLDEKYSSIRKYPVAVSLAQIGIPSIRGLLKEIAQGKGDNPEYIEISYKTMSTILPSVAVLGFVDEAIENEKSEEAKSRLEKLYPFLPQQDEIDQRIKKRQEKEKTEK